MAKKSESKQAPKKIGRPSKYSDEMALRICEAIATCTDSYSVICEANPDFPDKSNMRLWRYRHPEFRAMYDQAKRDQAELIIEEVFDIADDGHNDWMLREYKDHEAWVVNGEAIARSRLRIDTRKWVAAKLVPRIYGDNKQEDEVPPERTPEIAELTQIINRLVTKYEREY